VIQTDGRGRGNNFALKYLDNISTEERQNRFSEERGFLESTDHPSILRYHDTGTFEGTPFMVAEYLPKTLSDVIQGEPISIPEKISYSVQLLSALRHLKSIDPPVIHRDIKPSNIFIKANSCVLGDFGLLKRVNADEDGDNIVWRESEEDALPHFYRSPDLVSYVREDQPLTPKSDVFQLGLVLAELFTGWNPANRPEGDDPLSPVELDDIGYIPGELSGSIVALLDQMLKMDPDERPTAESVMDGWMSLFGNAANRARSLNGRVF
jgi:serine/threonine protein kinase